MSNILKKRKKLDITTGVAFLAGIFLFASGEYILSSALMFLAGVTTFIANNIKSSDCAGVQ